MSDVRKELLARVTSLIERCHTVSISAPEDTGYFSIDPVMIADVQELLAETADLLRDIGVYFEELLGTRDVDDIRADDETGFLREIGASISTELASRELADLAFMGCSEILDIQRELKAAVAARSFWKVLAHADAGMGRATRALVPIESAMREYEGLPAMRRRWENLGDSLEIRRQYGMLWRAAQRAGSPAGEDLKGALRKIGRRIAILRRLKIYPFLRIDDRLAIRRLQKRILAYLQRPEEEPGRRLWNEVVAFFGLLKQINNRQELCEHDRQVVLTAHYDLSKKAARGERVPPEVRERLESLLGRDDELDRVLLRVEDPLAEDFLAPLARLKDELLKFDAPLPVNL